MLNRIKKEDVRYYKMNITSFGINYLQHSSPWAAAWWSAALPGFGHLYLGSYVKGFTFMTWEILVNLKANLNLAIYYTFIGDFSKANDVFNERWGIFYMAVWLFAMYDAYRLSVEFNKIYELEGMQEKRHFEKFRMGTLSIDFLEQRPPWLAAFFSGVLGGIGHIYMAQFVKGFILLTWTIAINYYAQVNHLFVKTILGREIFLQHVNWQWLLFWPSIYGFCIWDSYVNAIEINKLLVEEQRYVFGQKINFHAISEGRHYPMYLLGTCKQSVNLELIVSSLKTQGFEKYAVIFLDRLNNNKRETGDSIRKSDGISNFNGAICGAAIFMLFGTMWGGAIIPGGPIAIGLAGFLIGAIIGYTIDRYIVGWIRAKMNWDTIKSGNSVDGEVLICVNVADEKQYDYVSKIFAEKDVRFVGEVEGKAMADLVL